MSNSAKFDHELNNIRLLVSSEKLTLIEKGELFSEFCKRYDIPYKNLARMITGKDLKEKEAKEYKELHRDISIFRRYNNATPEEQEKLKGISDRNKWILLRLKEPNKQKKIDFILRNMKGLPTAEVEALVAILNGDKQYNEYEEKIRIDYERRRDLIRKLKKEMLGL